MLRKRMAAGSQLLGAVVALAMLVAGCSNSPAAGHPAAAPTASVSASPNVTVTGLPAGHGLAVKDQGIQPAPAAGATFASHIYSLTPSGPLGRKATITLTLDHEVAASSTLVVATRETSRDPWSYLPAQLTTDRRHIRFQTGHFSLFGALLLDTLELAKEFKKGFIDGISGGITATASRPQCADEASARQGGFTVTSDNGSTVYWCFGIENGGRVLKVTNTRPYPLEVQHPNMSVLSNPVDYGALASASRLAAARLAIIAPRETATFNADLNPGDAEGVSTAVDGLGQSLYAFQVGVETLIKILTRFGAGGPKEAEVMDALLTTSSCVNAVSKGSGALISGCFSPAQLFDAFGAKAALLVPFMVAGPVVTFFDSQVEALISQFTGSDQYRIVIRRAAASFSAFEGPWYGHTRGLEVDSTGTAKVTIDDGCCTHAVKATYQLSNPHRSGSSWLATATITSLWINPDYRTSHDPKVGDVRTLRITDGQVFDPYFDTNFCNMSADVTGACGA